MSQSRRWPARKLRRLTERRIKQDIKKVKDTSVAGSMLRDGIGYKQVEAVNEQLANDLL